MRSRSPRQQWTSDQGIEGSQYIKRFCHGLSPASLHGDQAGDRGKTQTSHYRKGRRAQDDDQNLVFGLTFHVWSPTNCWRINGQSCQLVPAKIGVPAVGGKLVCREPHEGARQSPPRSCCCGTSVFEWRRKRPPELPDGLSVDRSGVTLRLCTAVTLFAAIPPH